MRTTGAAAAAAVLILAAAARADSFLDRPAPEPAVSKWVVGEAPPAFKALKGRCALLEITDPEDLVCQGLASRTKELALRGAGRDLLVVSIATGRGGDEELAKDFAKKSRYDWAVGVDRKGETWFAAGSPNLPWCFLVAPDGRVLWEGSPGGLGDPVLDAFLDRARLWRAEEISKPVRTAAEAFAKGKLGLAWKKAEEATVAGAKKVLAGDADAVLAAKDAALVKEGVDFIADIRLRLAERMAVDRWSIDARELLEGIVSSCAGTPWEGKAKDALAKIADDKRAQKEIEAMVRLREILGKMRPPTRLKAKQALSAIDDFLLPYGNLVAGERARAEKRKIESLLEKL
jgi:hypothetical protein